MLRERCNIHTFMNFNLVSANYGAFGKTITIIISLIKVCEDLHDKEI